MRAGWVLLAGLVGLGACTPAGPSPERPEDVRVEPEPGTDTVFPVEPPPPEELTPLTIGVLVPQTGSAFLRRVGELVLEGVQLAVEDARLRGREVELVVLDDAGSPSFAASRIGELERMGAGAVIGPLLSGALTEAAQARTGPLLLVSPTAADLPPGAPSVLSIATQDTEGARALADYAMEAGLRRVAVLYPSTPDYARKAAAFSQAVSQRGGTVTLAMPYDSGTTTFETPLRLIAADSPRALYVPGPGRDVRQIAPQLAYYGLRAQAVQILGDEAWVEEETLRRVPPEFLEGVIASTPVFRRSPEVGWNDFVERYESKYRRTLDNPYPAYGYDAARLILESATTSSMPYDIAVEANRLAAIRGATGVLSVVGGTLVHRPFLVQITNGAVSLAPPAFLYMPPQPSFIIPSDTAQVQPPSPR